MLGCPCDPDSSLQAGPGVWMVGPSVGQDFGGILNRDGGECPESLVRDWEYYMSVEPR